jgi:hypothetical protein
MTDIKGKRKEFIIPVEFSINAENEDAARNKVREFCSQHPFWWPYRIVRIEHK